MAFLVLLGLAGFIILSNFHNGEALTASQKQKALTDLLGRAPITTPVDHATFKMYSSSVVGFLYPAWATINTNDNIAAKRDPLTVDSFHFTLPDEHMTGIVSVTRRLTIAQVADDPGVGLRLHDATYTKIGSISATTAEFMNADIDERSLFIFNENNVYALVISGGGDSDNEMLFERMKSSLKF